MIDSLEMVKMIKTLIDGKLGEDIVCLDLRGISSIADFMVIATGKADTHVKAISENMVNELKKKNIRPFAQEGIRDGVWACVDYGDVIVHVMRPAEREFYNLQAIWGACPRV